MFLFWAETDKYAKQRRVKLGQGPLVVVAPPPLSPLLRGGGGALATLTLLGGCGGSRSQRATGPALATGPACVRLLVERGIAVQPWQGGTRACPIDTPIRAPRGSVAAFAPPLETSCSMLLAWSS